MRNPDIAGYRGVELERDVFGTFEQSPEFTEAFKKIATDTGYTHYEQAMALIRDHYPGDPENPEKEFANDLRLEIMDLLSSTASDVQFYTAVGTALDHFHGIDAWIEIRNPQKKGAEIITLDVTLNKDKQETGHKADLIIPEIPSPSSDQYLDTVAKIAKQVLEKLEERQVKQVDTTELQKGLPRLGKMPGLDKRTASSAPQDRKKRKPPSRRVVTF